VDEDTPVEEAEVVCRQKAVYNLENDILTFGTTVLATTTGEAIGIATVTNPANLTLPTTDAEPIDVSGTTSRRLPSRTTPQPTPVQESEDQVPGGDDVIATGEPDLTTPGDAGLQMKPPGTIPLGILGAAAVLANLL
jgi:hypothetical protein